MAKKSDLPDVPGVKWYGEPDPEDAVPKQAAQPTSSGGSEGMPQLIRQLGLTARMAVHGATGTSGALADAGVGAINKIAGTQMPMPSIAQEQMMNRFLPQPEGGMEKAVQAVGAPMAGAVFDPFMAGSARAGREMLPEGFQDIAKNMSPEMLKRLETLGSVFGGGAGVIAGHKLGGLLGGGAGGYIGSKVGRAGGEALAKRLLISPTPFMGNSPNMARYMTQAPLQWLTPRESEQ